MQKISVARLFEMQYFLPLKNCKLNLIVPYFSFHAVIIIYGCLVASDPVTSKSLVAIDAGIAFVLAVILPIKKPPGMALAGLIEELIKKPKLAAPAAFVLELFSIAKYQAPGVMFWVAEVTMLTQTVLVFAPIQLTVPLALLAKDRVEPLRE